MVQALREALGGSPGPTPRTRALRGPPREELPVRSSPVAAPRRSSISGGGGGGAAAAAAVTTFVLCLMSLLCLVAPTTLPWTSQESSGSGGPFVAASL